LSLRTRKSEAEGQAELEAWQLRRRRQPRASAGADIPEGLPTKPLTIKHADGTKEFFVPAPIATIQKQAADPKVKASYDALIR
jgi:hypothetical protein